MVRDLRRLAAGRFDVLVIGAGVYGAATAWDAVDRGLSVALVDRGDFGGGTSFNSLKTLHGGLRSLQALNLEQMRRFIRERRALARIVPHLVRPLPFLIPTTRNPRRSRSIMRIALALNDLVAHDRNEGIADRALHLPAGHLVSRDEALRLNPFVAPEGVTGGAVWHDYQMTNADRVTFSFTLTAAAAGATVANYVAAGSFLVDDGRVVGARLKDLRSGVTFDVRASVVVNAAGAWAPELVRTLPGGATSVPAPRLSRAMNVVLDSKAPTHACGGVVDGRFLFLVPWRGVSMLGTSHDVHEGPADSLGVSHRHLEQFLREGRAAFPNARLAPDHVRLVHRGLLPMVSSHNGHVQLLRESTVVDHAAHGAPGLISIHGVRYTTARHTAQEAVDAVFRTLGHHTPPRCRTEASPLFGGGMQSASGLFEELTTRGNPEVLPAVLSRLVATYGTEYGRVLRLARQTPSLGAPLGRTCAVTGAEVVYAARHEMAVTLADALIRRTEAGSAGHPGADAVEAAATLMAAEHGWEEARRRDEIASVDNFYRLAG
jgi:glycerol-3-phosphate dehydrogenase